MCRLVYAKGIIILRANNTRWWLKRKLTTCAISTLSLEKWDSENEYRVDFRIWILNRLMKVICQSSISRSLLQTEKILHRCGSSFKHHYTWSSRDLWPGGQLAAVPPRDQSLWSVCERWQQRGQTPEGHADGHRHQCRFSLPPRAPEYEYEYANAVLHFKFACMIWSWEADVQYFIVSDRFHSGWESFEGCVRLLPRYMCFLIK